MRNGNAMCKGGIVAGEVNRRWCERQGLRYVLRLSGVHLVVIRRLAAHVTVVIVVAMCQGSGRGFWGCGRAVG